MYHSFKSKIIDDTKDGPYIIRASYLVKDDFNLKFRLPGKSVAGFLLGPTLLDGWAGRRRLFTQSYHMYLILYIYILYSLYLIFVIQGLLFLRARQDDCNGQAVPMNEVHYSVLKSGQNQGLISRCAPVRKAAHAGGGKRAL